VVVLAQDEARTLGHGYIGTEHLLLGLVREEEGLAARTLRGLGVTLDGARSAVEERTERGTAMSPGQIPFTPTAKKTLELALRQALSFKHNYIGTEHILLGLAAADEQWLTAVGISGAQVRDQVVSLLGGDATGAAWEYTVDRVDEPVDAKLERFRAEGWEILSVRVERRRRRPGA
jgi:ATP-dependent Clp protease ATP-binding subunit ClpC